MEQYYRKIESISKDLKAEAVVVDEVAHYKLAGASRYDNYRSPDSYVFIIFQKSKGIHTIDFEKFEERDLQIHISFPGQIHSWNTEECAIGHKLIIKKEFLENLIFDSHLLRSRLNRFPVLDISKQFYQKLVSEINMLEQELIDFNFEPIIKVRTELIIRLIDTQIGKHVDKDQKHLPQGVLNFYDLLNEHFIMQKGAGFYAEKLSLSKGHLTAMCREYTGHTAKEIIDQRIILEAKRLLLGSNSPIKEITYKLDFGTMSRFSIFFKAKTGYNPKDFRARFRTSSYCHLQQEND